VKDRLHHHMANDDVTYPVGLLSPETLRVALRPVAEFRMAVARLVDSRGNAGAKERNRIDDRFPAELKLLRRRERRRILCIADEEIRKHA
jgi:hypothetical protein